MAAGTMSCLQRQRSAPAPSVDIMTLRTHLLLSLLLAGAARSVDLQAQEPVSPDSAAPVDVPGVTVTVLRTPIPIARAPYAVSVVEASGASASRPGLALDEALRAVPGVQVDNRYNYALGERISIRGFGARAQFGVRGVRVFVDGVPATFPDGQTSLSHLDLGYLSRAEVIRGPASALYGGGAGGVLQLETRIPLPGQRMREATILAGSHDLLRASAAVGEASDKGTYLVRLSHQGYGGARAYSDARSLRFHAVARYRIGSADLAVTATGVDYEAENPGSLSAALLEEDRTQAYGNNVAQQTGEEGRQAQLGATLRLPGGPGEAELTAYGITRSVVNPIPVSIIDLDRNVLGARAVYRISGARWTAAFGGELSAQRDDRLNFGNDEGTRGARSLDQQESVDDVALFGQSSFRPLQALTILGGLRFDRYRFSADDRLVQGTDPDDSGSIRMAELSPSIGATITLDPRLSLYGNVATAFETPTTTELANRPEGAGGFNPDLRPQETVAYELGAKGRAASARYELSAYTADVTNALIPFEVEGAPDRQFFRNAGSARHRGLEAALGLERAERFRARLAYTWTDARFREYEVDATRYDGHRIPGVAPHRVEGVLELFAGRSFAAIESRHSSRTPVDDANSTESPSYFVTDLRLGWSGLEFGDLRLEPVVGVQNVLAAEYNSSVVVNAFGGRYFEPAPGRTFHVGVTAGF